jgi:hypothetical protein
MRRDWTRDRSTSPRRTQQKKNKGIIQALANACCADCFTEVEGHDCKHDHETAVIHAVMIESCLNHPFCESRRREFTAAMNFNSHPIRKGASSYVADAPASVGRTLEVLPGRDRSHRCMQPDEN